MMLQWTGQARSGGMLQAARYRKVKSRYRSSVTHRVKPGQRRALDSLKGMAVEGMQVRRGGQSSKNLLNEAALSTLGVRLVSLRWGTWYFSVKASVARTDRAQP